MIFGYKQQGQPAIDSLNTFYYLTYEKKVDFSSITDPHQKNVFLDQIMEYGQTPKLLFTKPHPLPVKTPKSQAFFHSPFVLSAVKPSLLLSSPSSSPLLPPSASSFYLPTAKFGTFWLKKGDEMVVGGILGKMMEKREEEEEDEEVILGYKGDKLFGGKLLWIEEGGRGNLGRLGGKRKKEGGWRRDGEEEFWVEGGEEVTCWVGEGKEGIVVGGREGGLRIYRLKEKERGDRESWRMKDGRIYYEDEEKSEEEEKREGEIEMKVGEAESKDEEAGGRNKQSIFDGQIQKKRKTARKFKLVQYLNEHNDEIVCLECSHNFSILISADRKGCICLWLLKFRKKTKLLRKIKTYHFVEISVFSSVCLFQSNFPQIEYK